MNVGRLALALARDTKSMEKLSAMDHKRAVGIVRLMADYHEVNPAALWCALVPAIDGWKKGEKIRRS